MMKSTVTLNGMQRHRPGVIARMLRVVGVGTCWLAGCEDGAAPSLHKAGVQVFEEVASARGVDFVLDSGDDGGKKLFPEIMPGGIAIVDVDRDGDLDLYFVQMGPIDPDREGDRRNRLYLNDGKAGFTDVSEASGADDPGAGCGVATGDFDGDGDVDLYVTNLGRNTLLRNDGDGRFVDVTAEAGVGDLGWGASAAFLDYDLDGDLDLFVVNYVEWTEADELACKDHEGRHDYCSPKAYDARTPDVLYRNEGDGTFVDVSSVSGIDQVAGNGLGVVWGDFDRDGWPDIFVANDGNPNHLFLGREGGVFEEAARARGVYLAKDGDTRAGMGVACGDPDEDGDLDILVVNLLHQFDSYFQNDEGFFLESTAGTGLAAVTRRTTRFGVGYLDVDNDSRLDLYEASGRVMVRKDAPDHGDPFAEHNHLMIRDATGRYHKVPPVTAWGEGLVHTSRGAAFGDLDGDGGVDVVVSNRDAPAYVKINVAPRGGWCGVRVLDDHGAPALGAMVTAEVDGRRLRRDVHAAYSYLCANEPIARFGLGDEVVLREVEIRWPDGRSLEIGELEAGRIHVFAPPSGD
ncbi:MAG: hypothetical protein CMJ54_07965 [Planctomycetaceae bacterium]|nr:hypothetical protein [Planctomycetaceae bacterium]